MATQFSGINPANVVPMTPDGSAIDQASLERHLTDLVETPGVNGIVTNGHAGELYALSPDERDRIVEIAADVADDDTPVVSGVVAGSTADYAEGIERVVAAGADGILVVPPHTPIHNRRAAALGFFEAIASASDVPLIVFQHPHWAGGHYPPDLLAEIAAVDGVVAIKDAVWDVDHYQEDHRALRDADADVDVLVASDEHLLPCFSLGCDGVVLELAAVIPELVRDLYDAVEAGDVERARVLYARMEPFVDAMYEPPVTDSHTRLKVALELQGVIDSAAPRPPAAPIPDDEVAEIERAMDAAGVA
jgi:4-hydroxy-tetrahydrodipicolinate synthase